ncbi:MAG: hypothetical protein N2111_11690 [Candidatus Sumerlaeaceae bacterium]|nr:hypothetical protein [Candidatus Sumerlaeaceae bacterium]
MTQIPAKPLLAVWWEALVTPDEAARLVVEPDAGRGLSRFLTVVIALLYALYGAGMGLFRGAFPAAVSAAKLPMLYLLSLAVALPAFYVLNCLAGPRLGLRGVSRLLLLAVSANAAALASYAPVAWFFALTTGRAEYEFIVLMHVVVFAVSGILSILVIGVVFRATARRLGMRFRPAFLFGWAALYGVVGSQMSWVLRPWIGSYEVPYTVLRSIEGSFFESVFQLIRSVIMAPPSP